MSRFNISSRWVDCENVEPSIEFKEYDIVVNNLPSYLIVNENFKIELEKIHEQVFKTINKYIMEQIEVEHNIDYLRKVL